MGNAFRTPFSEPFDKDCYLQEAQEKIPAHSTTFENPYPIDGSRTEEIDRVEPLRREVPFGFVASLSPEIQYNAVEAARCKVTEAIDRNPPRHPDVYARQ